MQMLTAVVASSLGWALDLFDLFILLFVAPVIAKLFFPSSAPMLALAGVYASFAVTLFMRPVGSALFGSYADRHGRKGAMIVAVIGVGVSTALFGALPTLDQVGIAAPVLFIALRLVQGVFVGGVVASSHTIGTESVPPHWRGAMSGLVGGGGGGLGALFASLDYLAASALFPGESFAVWGWRFMFFTGILSAVLGVVIFNKLDESPVWAQLKRQRATPVRSPIGRLFSREFRGVMAVNIMLSMGAGAGYYLTSGFMPTFFKVVNKLPNQTASLILIAGSLAAVVSAITAGHISQHVGRRPVFRVMGVLRLAGLPLCILGIADAGQDVAAITGLTVLMTILATGSYAPLLIFLNERFPTAMRSSGTGLSWNIGFALGGVTPALVSLAAPNAEALPIVLAVFVAGVSLVFVAGAWIAPETLGAAFSDLADNR
jgi:MFS family permease